MVEWIRRGCLETGGRVGVTLYPGCGVFRGGFSDLGISGCYGRHIKTVNSRIFRALINEMQIEQTAFPSFHGNPICVSTMVFPAHWSPSRLKIAVPVNFQIQLIDRALLTSQYKSVSAPYDLFPSGIRLRTLVHLSNLYIFRTTSRNGPWWRQRNCLSYWVLRYCGLVHR